MSKELLRKVSRGGICCHPLGTQKGNMVQCISCMLALTNLINTLLPLKPCSTIAAREPLGVRILSGSFGYLQLVSSHAGISQLLCTGCVAGTPGCRAAFFTPAVPGSAFLFIFCLFLCWTILDSFWRSQRDLWGINKTSTLYRICVYIQFHYVVLHCTSLSGHASY